MSDHVRNADPDAVRFPRAIAHVDGDAFFTSVEQALRPELRGRPVVTGAERGIIACASYEAKAQGVKRGVSLRDARRLCPDLVLLESDYEAYTLFSRRMMNILRRFTPFVEEYSIDEGFADLTGMRRALGRSYGELAAAIRDAVRRELDITVSVGLSTTKCLAKIASDFRKPNGLTLVPQEETRAFLEQVPLADVWGLGPRRVRKLEASGLRTAADFIARDERWIRAMLHKPGWDLWRELRGEAVLAVDTAAWRPRHSIGKSRTFSPPSRDAEAVYARLLRNVAAAFGKLARYDLVAGEIRVQLRAQDFTETETGCRLDPPARAAADALPAVRALFETLFRPGVAYRTTGIALDRLGDANARQAELFEDRRQGERREALRKAVETIHARFGRASVTTATELVLNKSACKEQPRPAARPLRIPTLSHVHRS